MPTTRSEMLTFDMALTAVAISTTVIFLCLLNKMDSNFTSTRQIPLIADLIKLHTLQFLPAAEYFS